MVILEDDTSCFQLFVSWKSVSDRPLVRKQMAFLIRDDHQDVVAAAVLRERRPGTGEAQRCDGSEGGRTRLLDELAPRELRFLGFHVASYG